MARPRMRDNLSFSVPEHIRKKLKLWQSKKTAA